MKPKRGVAVQNIYEDYRVILEVAEEGGVPAPESDAELGVNKREILLQPFEIDEMLELAIKEFWQPLNEYLDEVGLSQLIHSPKPEIIRVLNQLRDYLS